MYSNHEKGRNGKVSSQQEVFGGWNTEVPVLTPSVDEGGKIDNSPIFEC